MTTLIRGGTVVNHDHSTRADVLIDAGRIVAIGDKLDAPTGADVIDAGGCVWPICSGRGRTRSAWASPTGRSARTHRSTR